MKTNQSTIGTERKTAANAVSADATIGRSARQAGRSAVFSALGGLSPIGADRTPQIAAQRFSGMSLNPSYTLDNRQFLAGHRCIVYAWVRLDIWLYVGFSGRGLARVYAHNKILPTLVTDEDQIHIWECDTEENAQVLESFLITKHMPLHNKQMAQLKYRFDNV